MDTEIDGYDNVAFMFPSSYLSHTHTHAHSNPFIFMFKPLATQSLYFLLPKWLLTITGKLSLKFKRNVTIQCTLHKFHKKHEWILARTQLENSIKPYIEVTGCLSLCVCLSTNDSWTNMILLYNIASQRSWKDHNYFGGGYLPRLPPLENEYFYN